MWTVPYNNNILNSKHHKLFTSWLLKICLCSVFLVSATFTAPQLSVTSNQTHLNVTVSPPMAAWNCSIENIGFWGKGFLRSSVKYTVRLTHPESLAGKVIIPASPSVVIRIHAIIYFTLLFYVLVALSIYTVCGNVCILSLCRYLRARLAQCSFGLWRQTCSTVVMCYIHSHIPVCPVPVKTPPFVWLSQVIQQFVL